MPEYLFPERNEYLDKYLFPFEKGEELEATGAQFFELIIYVDEFMEDESYISEIKIPKDIKYCLLTIKFYEDDEYGSGYTSNEELRIINKINTIIHSILPVSQIEYLYCNDLFIKNISKYTNLKTLILDSYHFPRKVKKQIKLDMLPASLIRLEINVKLFSCTLDNLPPNLKVLKINTRSNYDYCYEYPHALNNLPSGLEILYFPATYDSWDYELDPETYDDNNYPGSLEHLPSGLKYLCLPTDNSKSIDFNLIPDSVEVIEIDNNLTTINDMTEIFLKINKYPTSLKKIYSNCRYQSFLNNAVVKKCFYNENIKKYEIHIDTDISKYYKT
jgi:hypothetical protein